MIENNQIKKEAIHTTISTFSFSENLITETYKWLTMYCAM